VLNSLHGRSIGDAKLAIVLVAGTGRDVVLTAGLDGGQIQAWDGTLSGEVSFTLAVDVLFRWDRVSLLSALTDKKRDCSTLKGLQGDVYGDWVHRIADQRTEPDNIAEA
jgi:hypothetical protein